MKDINPFIQKWSGQEVPDPWGGYKGECVSLVKQWLVYNGWPMRRGDAKNWQYNGFGGYKWFVNYPWSVPQPGDMIVFQVGSYGHIGLVVSAHLTTVAVFNQNWPQGHDTDPAQITTFDYRHPKCIGWLRKV